MIRRVRSEIEKLRLAAADRVAALDAAGQLAAELVEAITEAKLPAGVLGDAQGLAEVLREPGAPVAIGRVRAEALAEELRPRAMTVARLRMPSAALAKADIEAGDLRVLRRLELSTDDRTRSKECSAEPMHAADGIAYIAIRMLPASDRARYCDEYRSELYELAAARASWWSQLLYALRLLDRTWVLRAELRSSAAERARP
jgi:hypothetical protein